ncbi:hypothetical protein [Streptomyces sp. NPDC089799]|uniref:hypothetical protein n=1 Tax=Streptomyces sp. NPDC089799 TaxID=3155066 RepID=UPI00344046F5
MPGAIAAEVSAAAEGGDAAILTLLRTAAAERPLEEVASLVVLLTRTGRVTSAADMALRAAAVSRPLEEVRELVARLNASGVDLHQAETTLRAIAVGRPIDDVVEFVSLLEDDSSDWDPSAAGHEPNAVGEGRRTARHEAPGVPDSPAAAPAHPPETVRHGVPAEADGNGDAAPSAVHAWLRRSAVVLLFVCALGHLPSDPGTAFGEGLAVLLPAAVAALCLPAGVWLAVRETPIGWAVAASLASGIIILHILDGVRGAGFLEGSVAAGSPWAAAIALLGAAALLTLAASALWRRSMASTGQYEA